MRARWYGPVTAEFTSVDPDVAQTSQPYLYASDDPVNGSDPSGDASLPSNCAGVDGNPSGDVPRASGCAGAR
jgi:hypothetical protein